MQQTLIFVWQIREQGRSEMNGSYSFAESHISLARASQIPEQSLIQYHNLIIKNKKMIAFSMHVYLLYIYDYDSQTNSVFAHSCRHRTIDANPSTHKTSQ
jgi:hypothetical protein